MVQIDLVDPFIYFRRIGPFASDGGHAIPRFRIYHGHDDP